MQIIESSKAAPVSRRVITVLVLLFFGHFSVDFMIGIWPVYKSMLGLDLAKAGIIAALGALFGEGIQVLFGPLSDKGYGKILIMGGITAAIFSSFLSYTSDYYFLFILFLITCIGSGAFHPSAAGLISTLTNERKGLFITIFATGGALGLACSQIVFSNTYYLLDGNTLFLAIPPLCLVLCCFFYLIVNQKGDTPSSHRKLSFSAFGEFFRRKDLFRLYILQVCNQSIIWAVVFLLPDVLRSRGYEEWACFGGGHLFFILGSACGMIPSGYLADKFSSKKVIFSAVVFSTFAFYFFLLAPLSVFSICGSLFLLGASMGTVNPVSIAFGNRLMPTNPGVVSACLMGLVWCVAEGIGQGGGGLLTKLFVDDAPAKALYTLGLFFFPAIAAAYLLPATASKNVDFATTSSK